MYLWHIMQCIHIKQSMQVCMLKYFLLALNESKVCIPAIFMLNIGFTNDIWDQWSQVCWFSFFGALVTVINSLTTDLSQPSCYSVICATDVIWTYGTEQLPHSKTMSQARPRTSWSPQKPGEKTSPKSSEGGFSLCMACTVYVFGICLKCYVAVDVSECLSCCGDLEQTDVLTPFYGGNCWKARMVKLWFLFYLFLSHTHSLSLSLPLVLNKKITNQFAYISNMCIYFLFSVWQTLLWVIEVK